MDQGPIFYFDELCRMAERLGFSGEPTSWPRRELERLIILERGHGRAALDDEIRKMTSLLPARIANEALAHIGGWRFAAPNEEDSLVRYVPKLDSAFPLVTSAGAIVSMILFNDRLFVATTKGVFVKGEDDVFRPLQFEVESQNAEPSGNATESQP